MGRWPGSVADIEAGTKVGAGAETGAGNRTVMGIVMKKKIPCYVSRNF